MRATQIEIRSARQLARTPVYRRFSLFIIIAVRNASEHELNAQARTAFCVVLSGCLSVCRE